MAPRRDAREHLTAAMLYPQIKHVYVEGRTDARYIRASAAYPENCDVHAVEDVELELLEEERSPFLSGNRLRVALLAELFTGRLKGDNGRFLVDKDHEDTHPSLPDSPILVVTDYANLFSGELRYEWVRDAVLVGFGAEITEALWASLVEGCRFMFAFRALKQDRFPQAHLTNPSGYVAIDQGGTPRVSIDALCTNAATSPYIPLSALELQTEVTIIAANQQGDARNFINFGDFLDILRAFIRRAGLANNVPRDGLKTAIHVSMPPPSLEQMRLRALLHWMSD